MSEISGAAQQLGGVFASLNLSSTQQTQVSQILQTDKGKTPEQVTAEIGRILTPSQQAQFHAELAKIAQLQHHHFGGGSHRTPGSIADTFGIPTPTSSTTNSGNLSNIAANFSTQQLLNKND